MPTLAAACAERWGLALEEPVETPRSLVVPAGDAVLKLNAPSHYEADHEPDALACWAGRGAVRLLARDDALRALLLERCRPGTHLSRSGADEPSVVCDLLTRLGVEPAAPHPFRSLADEAVVWAEQVRARHALRPDAFDRRLLDFAVATFRTADSAATRLVNQDLHPGNVLRADREPWLVIDPKPLVGEPELDGVGLLRNAAFDAGASAASVRRWLDALEGLGLDRERLRAWGVAHALAWGWDEEHGWSARSVAAAAAIFEA